MGQLEEPIPNVAVDEKFKEVIVESPNIDTNSIGSVATISSSSAANADHADMNKLSEAWYYIAVQVTIPFLLAGMGTIWAGYTLAGVEQNPVFQTVDSLFVLVPAIIGLKGNLDMCLASRISTRANMGAMSGKGEMLKIAVGNIGLVQVQAIVASVLVSLYATLISCTFMLKPFNLDHALLVIASSILTASVSCLFLDCALILIIFGTHHCHINPDNLATPIAASIGDVLSLTILSTTSTYLYGTSNYWLIAIIACYLVIALPFWVLIVSKNECTRPILTEGWCPVLFALFISGFSGLLLDNALGEFQGFAVFQPIINGVGGNLVSVQASRISTMLHKSSLPNMIPPHTKMYAAPWTALFKGVLPARSARILIAISIPGQFIFVYAADFISNDLHSKAGLEFVLTYVSVSVFQVMLLLYVAHLLVHYMWSRGHDPDNAAIPCLTALGDLSGTGLLLVAFIFLRSIGSPYTPAR